jgi:hypothetical protein
MDPAQRLAAFKRIKEHYDALDREGLRHGKLPMHHTGFGFWGTTNMNDAYAFFARIKLERFRHFVDLGCGDGRIVLIASLFTDATGIEGDKGLIETANHAVRELVQVPERNGATASMNRCIELKHKNYYDEDFSPYDVIFMFPDTRYDATMVGKLLSEFTGYLFVYNRIHAPPGIPAGKTYWVEQMPIASYPIKVEEENLELH